MAWFKVDDQLAFHPKVLRAGNAAMGLWVRCGSYSAQFETDGWLDLDTVRALGGHKRDIDRLVEVGLWHREDGGVRFHDWTEFQPTKAQLDSEREATRARVERWREKKRSAESQQDSGTDLAETRQKSGTDLAQTWHKPDMNTVSESSPHASRIGAHAAQTGAGNAVTGGVTNGSGTPAPSRPDPTRPNTEAKASADRRAQGRNHPLPADWKPTPEHEARAAETGLDLNREIIKFQAHAEEKGRLAKNWNAAFTRWLINAADYAARDARLEQARTGYRSQNDIMRDMQQQAHTQPPPLRAIEGGP